MTYVKNASGTSRWSKPSTGESSWLEYWEKKTGKKATRCGATDCHSTGTLVGAHVQKVFGGSELYITPLCTGCNQRSDNFWVDTELVRVPSGFISIHSNRCNYPQIRIRNALKTHYLTLILSNT